MPAAYTTSAIRTPAVSARAISGTNSAIPIGAAQRWMTPRHLGRMSIAGARAVASVAGGLTRTTLRRGRLLGALVVGERLALLIVEVVTEVGWHATETELGRLVE